MKRAGAERNSADAGRPCRRGTNAAPAHYFGSEEIEKMSDARSPFARWPERLVAAVAGACFVAAIAAGFTGFTPAFAAEPEMDRTAPRPCCGAPLRGELTADQMVGRWIVLRAGIDTGLKPGEKVRFRRDGSMITHAGACRFAILREELTVACDRATRSGDAHFIDDNRVLWRQGPDSVLFMAPVE
jgi:hypothetical protein